MQKMFESVFRGAKRNMPTPQASEIIRKSVSKHFFDPAHRKAERFTTTQSACMKGELCGHKIAIISTEQGECALA